MFAGRENSSAPWAEGTGHSRHLDHTTLLFLGPRLDRKQSHFREGYKKPGAAKSPVHAWEWPRELTPVESITPSWRTVCQGTTWGCVCPCGTSGDLRSCWVTGKVIVRQGEAAAQVLTFSGQGRLSLKASQVHQKTVRDMGWEGRGVTDTRWR